VHFLIGLGLFLALLYWWLLGHWFARVLVFLTLAALAALSFLGDPAELVVAVVLAWLVASLPVYIRRNRHRLPQWLRP
jgi:hypothetical protein